MGTAAQIERNTWDRRTDESPQAFEAFAAYRDLEPGERTLTKAANKVKKSVQLIHKWSCRYKWVDRASDWDVYCDQARQRGTIKERIEFSKVQLNTGKHMASKALEGLLALKTTRTNGNGEKVPAVRTLELVKMAEAACKMVNQVLPKPDEEQVTKIEVIVSEFIDDDPQNPIPKPDKDGDDES